MKRFGTLAALALMCAAVPSGAVAGDIWMCRYKGYTPDGQYYYIAVKPFAGNGEYSEDVRLNSHEFAKGLFDDLAPGNRFSGERACALRPTDVTEGWWTKLLAGDDYFSGPYNTTLAEWRDGRLVKVAWPKAKKK